MRRRVLYVTMSSSMAGAEVCLLALLDALDRTRFEPLVLAPGEGGLIRELARRGVDARFEPLMGPLIHGIRTPAALAISLARYGRVVHRLVRRVTRDHIDLLHAFIAPAFKYAGLAGRIAGVPVVGSLHDVLTLTFPWSRRRFLVANVNRMFDGLIVPSQTNRDDLLRAGVRADVVSVVHNGVALDRFAVGPAVSRPAREAFGVDATAFVVGTVGRLAPSKGHHVLLRALGEVARGCPELQCLIVGDAVFEGEEVWKARIRRLADDAALAGHVVFAGWRDDVHGALAAMDVFVHPATGPDSFPTAVLEAMAAGRPVIASNAPGGISEIVRDGVTGLLVPPGDATALAHAILRLAHDEPLRRRMGATGRAEAVARFSRERYTREVEAVYERVLPPTRVRPGAVTEAPTRTV